MPSTMRRSAGGHCATHAGRPPWWIVRRIRSLRSCMLTWPEAILKPGDEPATEPLENVPPPNGEGSSDAKGRLEFAIYLWCVVCGVTA